MTTLDDLDLGDEDQRMRAGPIEHAEVRIAALDEESYRVSQLAERSDDSLSEQRGDYKPEDAKALFAVARVVFGDQIKRDCDQLTEFNRADSQERRDALEEQRHDSSQIDAEVDGADTTVSAKDQALWRLRHSG